MEEVNNVLEDYMMNVSHKCLECGFDNDVLVNEYCRIIICPTCGTKNDFWLIGETPPENHKEELTE